MILFKWKIEFNKIPEYRATVLFPIKYDDIMNDSIQHSTSTGETHLSTTHGTHRVLFTISYLILIQ